MAKSTIPVCKRCKGVHPINTGVALYCKRNNQSRGGTSRAGSLHFVLGDIKVSFRRKAKVYLTWEGVPIANGFMH